MIASTHSPQHIFCVWNTFFPTIIRIQCTVNHVISFLLQYLKIEIGFGCVLHYERIFLKTVSNWRPPCQCIIFGVSTHHYILYTISNFYTLTSRSQKNCKMCVLLMLTGIRNLPRPFQNDSQVYKYGHGRFVL